MTHSILHLLRNIFCLHVVDVPKQRERPCSDGSYQRLCFDGDDRFNIRVVVVQFPVLSYCVHMITPSSRGRMIFIELSVAGGSLG